MKTLIRKLIVEYDCKFKKDINLAKIEIIGKNIFVVYPNCKYYIFKMLKNFKLKFIKGGIKHEI